MVRGLSGSRLSLAVMIGILVMLAPLAWLQYRWIGNISEAQHDRLEAHLKAAVSGFAEDFNAQLTRPLAGLAGVTRLSRPSDLPDLAVRLAERLETSPSRRFVLAIYAVQDDGHGSLKLARLDLGNLQFVPAKWPAKLESLRPRLASGPQAGSAGNGRPESVPFGDEFVALPMARFRPPRGGFGAGPEPAVRQERSAELPGWLIVEFDLGFLQKELLPNLVHRYFPHSGDLDCELRIVSRADPRKIIFSSNPALSDSFFATPDAQTNLLDIRSSLQRRFFAPGVGPPVILREGTSAALEDAPPVAMPESPGRWRLQVASISGSLDNVVGQARRRNLGISFAILLLLGASIVSLLLSTRRAQRLAQLQMEFVAGVSHELRTPLSVICSSADNLADGLVANEQQIRRYGTVIRAEGRRLGRMVEQILGFAGAQSNYTKYEFEPVDVREVISKTIADSNVEIGEAQWEVEMKNDAELPLVLGDPTALAHCIRNLVENALTHAARSKWIGIETKTVNGAKGAEVEIRVEDRGPGIDAADLGRIFDPFYRGRRAIEDQSHGFGLGLALVKRIVEAHSGSVTVGSTPGQGTCFVVRLPALAVVDAPSSV